MDNAIQEQPFWKTTPLDQMTREQWEALCDGCGRCCIIKYEDIDTHEIFYTDAVCFLLNTDTCRCSDYTHRAHLVPTCLVLNPDLVRQLKWMPETCAYRLLAEHKPLYWWHPLVSGDSNKVHEAGISVRGKVFSEKDIPADDLENHIIDPDDG